MDATEIEKILQKWSMNYGNLHAEEDDKIIEASDFEHIAKELEQRQEVVPHDTVVSLQELIDSIGWKWEGTGHYYVTMKNCGKIYCTTDADKRDLFIAQLKARLLTGLSN